VESHHSTIRWMDGRRGDCDDIEISSVVDFGVISQSKKNSPRFEP